MEQRSRRKPLPIAEVLQDRLRALGWERRLQEMEIFNRWEEAVGPQIAGRASPVQIRQGRLTVAVESPVWAQQLSLLKRELLRNIAAVIGDGLVDELYFVSGRIEPPAREALSPAPQAPLTPEDRRSAEKEASRIEDQDLREALRRVLEASCRRSPR